MSESVEWNDLGDQQSVWFFDVGAGDYTFEVLARDYHHRYSSQPARLSFRVLPRLYETIAFRGLVGGVTLGLLIWGHHVRIRRRLRVEKMQGQLRLETERRRLAQDMHDEIGASFAQLKILGELARRGRLEGQALSEALARIVVVARSGAQTLREILWSLENDCLPGTNLGALDERSIGSLLEGTNILLDYSYEWAGTVPELSPRFQREVLLIVKGLVSNVIRHSQATRFQFRLRGEDHEVSLACIDDGVGFDPNSIGGDSLGQQYIRERVRRWAGDVCIQSNPGEGTTVKIRLDVRASRGRES